jgi:hypothetical protein
VEVDLDFETSSIHFGNIRKNEGSSKEATIVAQHLQDVKITSITPSSPLITATERTREIREHDIDRIKFDLNVSPGFPLGLFSESIMVGVQRDSVKNIKLHLYGLIVDDVDFNPQVVVFNIKDTVTTTAGQKKRVTLSNYDESFALEVLGVRDPDNRLDVAVTKKTKNKRFDIMATINEDVPKGATINGKIIVTTNKPQYEEITIPYRISRPQ